MQVLVVDDHPLIQEMVRAILERTFKPCAVYLEGTLESALKRAEGLMSLDLVVLDLGLPGCTECDAFTRFQKRFPSLAVVVLSAMDTAVTIRRVLASGARGYIPKTSGAKVMESAFRLVTDGGTYVPAEALIASGAPMPLSTAAPEFVLSARQLDVLKRIAKGFGNRQIANELAISENTVKHHAHEIYQALGVATRTEALVAAMRQGLRFD